MEEGRAIVFDLQRRNPQVQVQRMKPSAPDISPAPFFPAHAMFYEEGTSLGFGVPLKGMVRRGRGREGHLWGMKQRSTWEKQRGPS